MPPYGMLDRLNWDYFITDSNKEIRNLCVGKGNVQYINNLDLF